MREKLHRLSDEMYIGKKAVAFTVCIKDKQKLFVSDEIIGIFERKLITFITSLNFSSTTNVFDIREEDSFSIRNASDPPSI